VTDDRPAAPLSRELYERGERTEREVDAFISRCHTERVRTGGERAEEAAWRESERRHAAVRRGANRSSWRLAATDVAKAGNASERSTKRAG
jgi:hypothetical protein